MSKNKLIKHAWERLTSYFSRSQRSNDVKNVDDLHLYSLEPRVLYDASPLMAAMDAGEPQLDQQLDVTEELAFAPTAENLESAMSESIDQMLQLSSDDAFELPIPGGEIVFVDERVEGYEQLVEDLLANSTNDYRIVLLNDETSGIDQISSYLDGSQDYDAVHVISHGLSLIHI